MISWADVIIDSMLIYGTKQVMGYIDGEYDDMYYALWCVAIMFMSKILTKGMQNYKIALELKGKNRIDAGLQTLLYDKLFRVSTASNREHEKGALNRLIQKGSANLSNVISQIQFITTLPFMF